MFADIPYGFVELAKAEGVVLYKKDYSGGKPDYVHVINLNQGAKLKFLYGNIIETGNTDGAYGGNNPNIKRNTLRDFWNVFLKNNRNAFSISNGQFFSTNASPSPLAFPLKVDNIVISEGYGIHEYPEQKLMLELWGNRADIIYLSEFNFKNSTAPNILAGLSEYADKGVNIYTARTFIGIYDKNLDGMNEMILIFNSEWSTQADAASILRSFGAQKIIMLDGGGSTQLINQNKVIIYSQRTIPQSIGVLSGE